MVAVAADIIEVRWPRAWSVYSNVKCRADDYDLGLRTVLLQRTAILLQPFFVWDQPYPSHNHDFNFTDGMVRVVNDRNRLNGYLRLVVILSLRQFLISHQQSTYVLQESGVLHQQK